jgi:hypothetical protein
MAPAQNGEHANGASKVSSYNSSSSAGSVDTGEKLASHAKPKPALLKLKPTGPDRQGVANALERYAQVLHAKVVPLPNQTGGNGSTFYTGKRWGKLRADLRTLRSAGMLDGPSRQKRLKLTLGFRLEGAEKSGRGQDQG